MRTDNDSLDTWIEADAELATRAAPEELEAMWGQLETELEAPGWRSFFTDRSTPARLAGAVAGLGLIAALFLSWYGIRGDAATLDWRRFGALGAVVATGGLLAGLWPLRPWSSRPTLAWPWMPLTWSGLLVFSVLVPWPGIEEVPFWVHRHCLIATSVTVVSSTVWLALWERSSPPAPQRIGLAASGAGALAFVIQNLHCPASGAGHLLFTHVGPGVVFAVSAFIVLTLLGRRTG